MAELIRLSENDLCDCFFFLFTLAVEFFYVAQKKEIVVKNVQVLAFSHGISFTIVKYCKYTELVNRYVACSTLICINNIF